MILLIVIGVVRRAVGEVCSGFYFFVLFYYFFSLWCGLGNSAGWVGCE